MAVGGLLFATAGGVVLHRLPGKVLLVFSGAGFIACTILFALMPEDPSYWAFVFPAMIGATVGVDITYSVSNIFITTCLPKHRQGLAGAIINSLLFLGISFFLGLADLVAASKASTGLRESYKTVFWFGLACSGIACLSVIFTSIGTQRSSLTHEERAQLELESSE